MTELDNMRDHITRKVALFSLIINIILSVGKLIIGHQGNSDSVFADGIHSAADVFASLIVLLVIGFASKPADKEHPYGHGKAEVIISGIVGFILLLVSFYIVFESVSGIFNGIKNPSIIALWVSLISYFLKEILYRLSMKVAKKHRSKALEAIALDHKADILASLAASLGVFASVIGQKYSLGFLLYGDIVASIIVAFLIFKIAKEMLVESFNILLERNVNEELISGYKKIILSFEEVKRIDKIRAREHGHYILVDLRISIAHDKSIKEGHDLGKMIKSQLMDSQDNIAEVLIHLNPYYE